MAPGFIIRSVTYDQLITYYGTPSKAAAAIGASKQRVNVWRVSGRVPLEAQIEFEVESKGALRADVPKEIRFGRAAA